MCKSGGEDFLHTHSFPFISGYVSKKKTTVHFLLHFILISSKLGQGPWCTEYEGLVDVANELKS